MNPIEITTANSRNAIKAIKEITDVSVLAEALKLESGKDTPRSTVAGALQMRIDIIKDAGEANVEEPTAEPTEPKPAIILVDEPKAEEPAVVEPTPTENCAVAFLAALKAGDSGLTAVLIAEVRREDADNDEMAEALVKAFAALTFTAKVKRASSPRKAVSKYDWSKAKGMLFEYTRGKHEGQAAVNTDGSLTLQAGAKVNPEQTCGNQGAIDFKAKLIEDGTLVIEDDMAVLTQEVTFKVVSTLGRFMCGKIPDGARRWVNDGQNFRQVCAL